MAGKIFISHSTQDKEVAGKVIEHLESEEFVCWVAPRDISPGMDWAESIIDGIDSASLMILIVSNWSNKSPQVRREVERAVSKGITIIPLIIEKIDLSKWMQYYVSAHQWIDASLSNIDNVFPALKESVQTVFLKESSELEGIMELAGKWGEISSINTVDSAEINLKPLTSPEIFPSLIKQDEPNKRIKNSTQPDNKTKKLTVQVADVKSGLIGFISGAILMVTIRLYFFVRLFFVKYPNLYNYSIGERIEYLIFEVLPSCYYEIAIYAFLCGFTAIAIARTLMRNQPMKFFLLGSTASFLVIGLIAIVWVSVEPIAIQRIYLLRVAPYILLVSCASGLLICFINRLVRKMPGGSCND